VDQLAVNKTIGRHSAFGRVLEAQTHLSAFQRLLAKSAKVGEQHRDIANRQAATVLLFMVHEPASAKARSRQ
jgi:hypothetical protein